MLLKDKIALVTGGSSGLGIAIAESFLREGAKVMISGRSEERCEDAMKKLRVIGDVNADFVLGDVSRADDASRMVDETVNRFGGIDILVNSAGIFLEKRAEDTSEDEWDMIIDTDLKGVFLCSKAAYPHFKRRGGGAIINISSDAGIIGNRNCVAYCAAKGGVSNLTRAMALDYAKENIRVNAVCPAVIDTPMFDKEIRLQQDPEKYVKITAEEHPIGRIGRPEEVAFATLMLASDQASFITGVNLPVDGGLTSG